MNNLFLIAFNKVILNRLNDLNAYTPYEELTQMYEYVKKRIALYDEEINSDKSLLTRIKEIESLKADIEGIDQKKIFEGNLLDALRYIRNKVNNYNVMLESQIRNQDVEQSTPSLHGV